MFSSLFAPGSVGRITAANWPESCCFAIGYYVESDRAFFNALARNYTTCDRFFASIMSETYPNRIFQHAAQTDRLQNTLDLATLPTIWDRLAEEGVSAKYYFSDVSFLLFWGPKYASISHSYVEFLADAAAGTLPSVSFVDPRFVEDASGTSGSDHPHADPAPPLITPCFLTAPTSELGVSAIRSLGK